MVSKRRIWQIIRNVILTLAVLVAGFLFLFVPWFFSNLGTEGRFHYPDPNDGKTPISYGMKFKWVDFPSSDGILLRGWYVLASGEAHGTIVYCHGLNRTRIEMLPMAAFGQQLGYDGLLFDFRHQGASGGGLTTLGYRERFDVIGAVHFALEQQKAARPVIVWGVSMGAAAALMAAAESADVAAVISDSSFSSLKDTVEHHWKLFFHLPSFPIADEVLYLIAWRGGFRPSDFDLVKAVTRMGDRPILFVALQGDRRMPPSIARTLYSCAVSPKKALIVLPGQRHGEGFNQAREQYENAVKEFLSGLATPLP
ncbi:MAG TPA: alpha/beta hydrolase [Terriglobia bacterium]|nr:alpha/beta hydrolase [Terriglobia bacterium]